MKIEKLKARREDLRLQAVAIITKAEAEDRFLSDDESKEVKRLEAEITRANETIKRSQSVSQMTKMRMAETQEDDADGDESNPAPAGGAEQRKAVKTDPNAEERKFKSFGEQLAAVYRAATPGGKIDDRLSTRAASGLNQTTPSDGGFLVEKDFVKELLKLTYETGILASRVKRIPISARSNGLKINAVDESSREDGSRWGGIQAFWEDEAGRLSESRPKFRQMELQLKKLTGLCYATDELLEDTVALESVISEGFAEEFGFKIDHAILSGDGDGKPLGIMKSGALVVVPKETGQTAKVTVENITKMWSRLKARNRKNALWFINQELEPYLMTLRLDGHPVYLPAGGLSEKPFATMLGRPVIALEQCNAAGEQGDIVLADISQYVMIDKGGLKAATSIHVRFLYDENVFRFIYRVDGKPKWEKPTKPFKGTATVSPYVTLARRNKGADTPPADDGAGDGGAGA